MKKTFIIIIHTLSVLLFVAGLSVIYMLSPEGFGISWAGEEDFVESAKFASMVNEDIAGIKEYALLRDTFEENGEITYDRVVVTAETSNGMTSYTLRELSAIAADYGCSLDPDIHRVTISTASRNEDAVNYQLKIGHKLYDPDYYAERPQGPGQGIMSLRDLSIEVMQELARYYELHDIYGIEGGNLYYFMHYVDSEGNFRDIYNTDRASEDMRDLGKYALVEGEGQGQMDTNISPAPDNAYELSSGIQDPFGTEDDYELAVGVDTTFPYEDRYSEAAAGYNSEIDHVYMGVAMMIAGLLIGLVSLILLIRGIALGGREGIRPSDSIAFEIWLLLLAAFGGVIYLAFRGVSGEIIGILAPSDSRHFFASLVNGVLLYGFTVYAFCVMIRRYEGGVLWKNTLLRRICDAASDFSNHGSLGASMLLRFLCLVVFNAAMGAAIMHCLNMRFESGIYMLIFCLLMVALVVADIAVFIALFRQGSQREELGNALKTISLGETGYEVPEEDFSGRELVMAKDINNISKGLSKALNEQVRSERLRADLITNVSHDIRTPLTSIINYVDLIKRENIENQKIRDYVDVLDKKSERLRNLTEDLLEASKASSGNVKLEMTKIDLKELAMQAGAEFEDKFAARDLELCLTLPEEPVFILADGRHLWRVLENLYNNAAKYAMEHTRIYADVVKGGEEDIFTIKNVSSEKLNVSPDELTERFVRGDESRHTEGSGLGLSIAKSLTSLMGGRLEIVIDGDLYKANIHLPSYREEGSEDIQDKDI